MADWDEDRRRLRSNLADVLADIRDDAAALILPGIEAARGWQSAIMQGLASPLQMVGRYRGEPGLEHCEVVIGGSFGVPASAIADELRRFEEKLHGVIDVLDGLVPSETELTADNLAAVLDLCAWVHAEWVRIHPFANGNGRTARLWANCIAMRYGLPPFVRLRPRPDGGYGAAAQAAMDGDWKPTAPVFRQMLREALRP
jgi:hypothetical protein